ncbi:ABC transporter permease [Taibaiella sp. KBW10]|uniref:cytochrome c biogenesis protein CcsA n=1 Tax=Taibaiella sp. KBW10 TaxID=2153357 RepID=UPI000F59CA0D|nr:cytochrome c biogenesis protein CcsA [Taibaiella sp. KBW10]RQO31738.1 ABC transporter permease [Taibaiella sp. KBW10]
MRKVWWKILCILLLSVTIIVGLLMPVPALNILNETIRNLYFHVPMWFGMMLLFTVSLVYAIRFLKTQDLKFDIYSEQFAKVGVLFGSLGMVTGMEWARFTWGEFWSNDPKQLASALSLLIYFAYLALRGSVPDYDKKAKISAVYNVFAYFIMIPLIMILPRLTASLHPGNGGNPGFGDLAAEMRPVFYTAVIGWFLLGIWIATLAIRFQLVARKHLLSTHNVEMDVFKK